MTKETFGDVIKKARLSKGWSLRELAKRVDISHPYLSQLENGHNDNPAAAIIYKLSRELEISFTFLIHLSSTDIGQKKPIPDDVLSILKILKPRDLEGWDTFKEFEEIFIKKRVKKNRISSNPADNHQFINYSEKLELYDYLKDIKRLENSVQSNALLDIVYKETKDGIVQTPSGDITLEQLLMISSDSMRILVNGKPLTNEDKIKLIKIAEIVFPDNLKI